MGAKLRAGTLLCLLLVYRSMGDGARLLGEVKKVEALLGGKAALPCDVITKDTNDSLLLLVWYKGNKPFYSYDGRLMRHWRSKELSGSSRALLTFHREPSALLLEGVEAGDQATYRCRADFSHSPTRNSGIALSVVILPSKPFFMDEIGSKVEHSVGPLHEGDTLLLVCLAVGGQPSPRLSWWKGPTLLDSTDEPSEVPGLRENQLLLTLTRDFYGSTIQCLAKNNNITAPISSNLQIDLYVSPETVNILSSNQPLSAGQTYELPCYINGSHPLPEISWWLDGKIITDQQIVTEVTRNEIMSTLHFKPKAEHNGQDLTCLATNAVLAPSHASKLHTMRLNIFFKPLLSLALVTNRYGNDSVHEGDVIQLRCMVEANPWISNTEWFANNETIQGSTFNNSGISMSSSDLLILNPSSVHSGNYSCKAYNLEGIGESNTLFLQVLYMPRCEQRKVLIDQAVESLSCPVISLPKPSKYFWRFENQSGFINENIIPNDKNILDVDHILRSLETNYADEIHISCWASNEVGEQKVPCKLYLKHAFRKPDAPKDCTVNASTNAIIVQCIKEVNYTPEQMYGLSIWGMTNNTSRLLNNISTQLSTIRMGDLASGQKYEILVYAFNKWGESDSVKLIAETSASLPVFDKTPADIGLWSGIALGIVLTIVLLVIILIIKKKSKSVINDELKKNTGGNTITRDKGNLITSSNADFTEKPLLYKNGKTATNGIILTRNNSEPKIIEDLTIVQNKENQPLPPSVSRQNKPNLPMEGGKTSKKRWTPGIDRTFETSKHRKEIKRSNGSIPMANRSLENMTSTLHMFSISKESIV